MILLYIRSRRDDTTNTNRMPLICYVLLPFILSLLHRYMISLFYPDIRLYAIISDTCLAQIEILSQYNYL